MALELRQQLKLAQKLVMTQQLRQAIKLLQLGRLELVNEIHAEIEQNPMLEEIQDGDLQPVNPDALNGVELQPTYIEPDYTPPLATVETPALIAETNWSDYANNFDSDFSFSRESQPADAPSQFDFISATPGLDAHLQWQLRHIGLSPKEFDLAHFIVGNLDGHGFFQADIEDIMFYGQVDREEAEGMLRLVQSLDPAGVAARDVRESLLLQLEHKGREGSLAYLIISEYMAQLELRDFATIARETGATVRRVTAAVEEITELTPYPGNEFSNEQTEYVIPDVYVYKIEDEFVIQLNNDGIPTLQLSQEYLTQLKENKTLPSESRSYLRDKQRNAEWFIKSIQQRQRTIYKVMESLLKFQREFFEKGPAYLKPLILRDVAEDISMHESTVSRVTSKKYAHTPQGIYELKYFFSTAVPTSGGGEAVASEAIKTKIRHFINQEDPASPLSDQKIAELLQEDHIEIARRTVAKYRDQMKILPVKNRRKNRA